MASADAGASGTGGGGGGSCGYGGGASASGSSGGAGCGDYGGDLVGIGGKVWATAALPAVPAAAAPAPAARAVVGSGGDGGGGGGGRQLILCAGERGLVAVDAVRGDLVQELVGHGGGGSVTHVAATPDGETIVSVGDVSFFVLFCCFGVSLLFLFLFLFHVFSLFFFFVGSSFCWLTTATAVGVLPK